MWFAYNFFLVVVLMQKRCWDYWSLTFMFTRKLLLVCTFCFLGVVAFGALNSALPQIGYLYPAGGQQGTVVQITAGGQFLRGASKVYVTGDGVSATVVGNFRQIININRDQRKILNERLAEVLDKRISELPISIRSKIQSARKPVGKGSKAAAAKKAETAKKESKINKTPEAKKKEQAKAFKYQMPKHPLLNDLDNKSIRELEHIKRLIFMSRSKLQPNKQLSELTLIEITIDAGAKPGYRELRIQTNTGLSKPIIFQVGSFPENYELEPNNRKAFEPIPKMLDLPRPKAAKLPAVFNGQVMPGDVDRFRFRATKGQKLVIEVHARSLIPYLADAVPGWFQATVALYSSSGKEVAYADDYTFNPDPVLFYEIGITGEYEVEIRDSIYRGREDFVYRIVVGEQPFITEMFPLGAKEGTESFAVVDGWNLTQTKLKLDAASGGNAIRHTQIEDNGTVSNSMSYAVDSLVECDERDASESNDTISDAQRLHLPTIINGRIEKSGDADVFCFGGKKDQEIVVEVYARRLNSPLDSFVSLTDARGIAIKFNDDYVVKESYLHKDMTGLVTHHADSYLVAKLPADGTYYVHLTDSQRHGGKSYGYRLRVCKRQGDFALRVTPSSLFMAAGSMMPLRVHVLRRDGFNGAIEFGLKDAPQGFKITGGRIPAGCDMVDVTLSVPYSKASQVPVALTFEGNAEIGSKTVNRQAMPADDTMQAFLFRHLVPSQQFLVAIGKSRGRIPETKLVGPGPVKLPASGSVKVKFKTVNSKATLKGIKFELYGAPEGISIEDVKVVGGSVSFVLKAEKDAMPKGFSGNLILEAYREYTPKGKNGKPGKTKRKASIGVMPAIPVELVREVAEV